MIHTQTKTRKIFYEWWLIGMVYCLYVTARPYNIRLCHDCVDCILYHKLRRTNEPLNIRHFCGKWLIKIRGVCAGARESLYKMFIQQGRVNGHHLKWVCVCGEREYVCVKKRVCVLVCVSIYVNAHLASVKVWVGSLKLQVSFAKEPYKRDDILWVFVCVKVCAPSFQNGVATGWRRLIGSPKLQIIFNRIYVNAHLASPRARAPSKINFK